MLSLSSSCSFHSKIFDVFLSFRGPDTRKSFISFLHKELKRNAIRTFLDKEELERGGQISQELNQAIKESRIAVVVVSPTYTASAWCLHELVKIVELKKEGLLTLMPIFYGVDPCDVRRQSGEVKDHFKKHETRESIETIESWRDALKYLANISGECSNDREDDSELVDKIMKDISEKLPSDTPSNGNKLIDIDEHMNELYPMLDLNSNQGVQVIGISGTGSMGRLALATHLYKKISQNFEAHCFLQDVSRVSLHYRKYHLKEEILSKMQGQALTTKGHLNEIKARVRNKKVLLVANDVDKFKQLDALVDESRWFGPGSIIIITTLDKQLLSSRAVNSVYEVGLMRCKTVIFERSKAFIAQRDNHVRFKRSVAFTQRDNQAGFERSIVFTQGDNQAGFERSVAFTQRDNHAGFESSISFTQRDNQAGFERSIVFTQGDNHVGFWRSHMNLSGNNIFLNLKYLVREACYWAQMISLEMLKCWIHPKTRRQQQLFAVVITFLEQKAKARRCSSRTVRMLSYY